jgi:hypothetical protein
MMVYALGFLQATLEGLDARAKELESKWGIGRLRLLVDDELRHRFDQQQEILRTAIAANDEEQIIAHASAMRRGWDALDAAATEAGREEMHPEVWECTLPHSGDVVSIVRTEAEARHVCTETEVWTVTEIAVLIERFGSEVRQIKQLYPGAMVGEIRDRQPDPPPFFDDTGYFSPSGLIDCWSAIGLIPDAAAWLRECPYVRLLLAGDHREIANHAPPKPHLHRPPRGRGRWPGQGRAGLGRSERRAEPEADRERGRARLW